MTVPVQGPFPAARVAVSWRHLKPIVLCFRVSRPLPGTPHGHDDERASRPHLRPHGGRISPSLRSTARMDPIVRALHRPDRVALTLIVAAWSVLAAFVVPAPARADWVRDDQWQLGALNVVAAWQHSTGAGVTVAVLDSGVDATHPDLVGQVLPGIDLVDGSTDGRRDTVGHGTT